MNKDLAEKLLTIGRLQGKFEFLNQLTGTEETNGEEAKRMLKELEEELISTGTLSPESESRLETVDIAFIIASYGMIDY